MKKAIFNWSGGKDSSLSLYYLSQEKEYDIQYLVTSINEKFQRISMHGVRIELLKQQAESIGIPLYSLLMPEMPSMDIYNQLMKTTLQKFRAEGISHSIFGDIFLEDLKRYREEQLLKVHMQAVFPIWKKPTLQLVRDFIDLGFKAVIVCINEKYLDQSFVGREIDQRFLNDLPQDVDPCGENGEYHSFVYEGPIFKKPIKFKLGDKVYRNDEPVGDPNNSKDHVCPSSSVPDFSTGFWYCDLLPVFKNL